MKEYYWGRVFNFFMDFLFYLLIGLEIHMCVHKRGKYLLLQ